MPTVARGLTVKQRRFVRAYVETGNGTEAALAAYDTTDPSTAHAIATENLGKPTVQAAVGELLDKGGLSDGKLAEIHARYLALHDSDDPQEKALALRALDMAYRLKGAYAPERHRLESGPLGLPAEAINRLADVLREVRDSTLR
jgi:hypothetical protein